MFKLQVTMVYMKKIKLIKPTNKYSDTVIDFRQECFNNEENQIHGGDDLDKKVSFKEQLENIFYKKTNFNKIGKISNFYFYKDFIIYTKLIK